MTDKQIIIDEDKFEKAENEPINQEAVNKFIEDTDKFYIDGVDVSGCENYIGANTKTHNRTLYDGYLRPCKGADCYYKQLKRKEQECKDLREDIKDIANLLDLDTGEEYNFGNIELEIKQLKEKEQECEELKREIDLRSCANIELSLEFKKYKKAIDEIEEIADNNYENSEMERIFKIIGGLDV